MIDYKFNEAAKINPAYRKFAESLKTPELVKPVEAFIKNVDRVVCLADFSIDLVDLAMAYSSILVQACMKVCGKPELESADLKNDPTIANRLSQEISPLIKKHAERELTDPTRIGQTRGRAANMLKSLLDLYPPVASGVEGVFHAILTGMWTAFETLAGDTWIVAVNSQPRYLAKLTGTEGRIERLLGSKARSNDSSTVGTDDVTDSEPNMANDDDEACTEGGGRKISLHEMCKLSGGGYDLSNRMGSLLVACERVNFTSLYAIRKAYSLAFSEKVRRARTNDIDKALTDRGLDALSVVRNLIVHRAGIGDATYLEDCKSAPSAPRLNVNDSLQLNGVLCRELIVGALNPSLLLIKSVDTWLTRTRR